MLDTPEYPEITWEVCYTESGQYACLNIENARRLGLYLAAVERYHDSIEQTCGDN